MVNAAKIKIEVEAESKKAADDLRKLQEPLSALDSFSRSFQGSGAAAFGAAALGAMAFAKAIGFVQQGFDALKDYVVNSVQQFAAFNYQLQLLEGLMDDQSASVESLGATIGAMSINSVYGVMDLAEAYKTLASMGSYNAKETEVLINSWQQLALVSGTELNQAVTIATQAMRVFGYTTDEAGTVADILYNATKEGALNMYDIGTALQYVGSNASMMNMTLAETTGLLAILSNRGFTASTAGTSLSMMFDTMIAPTEEAQKSLRQLGISIYDSEGNMRNMYDILEDLNAATVNMTDQQRNMYLSNIFGQRALRSSVALFEWMNSAEGLAAGGLRGFSVDLEEGGKVLTKYDDVMETAHARIQQMQNAWQQLSITAGGAVWGKGVESFDQMNQSLGPLIITGDGFTKVFEIIGSLLGQLGYLFGLLANTLNLVLQAAAPLLSLIASGLNVALTILAGAVSLINDFLGANIVVMQLLTTALGVYIGYIILSTAWTYGEISAQTLWKLSLMASNYQLGAAITLYVTSIAHIIAHTAANAAATVQQWLLNAAMYACPLTWMIGAIIALVAAVIVIIEYFQWWDDILNLLNGGIKFVTEAFQGLIDLISGKTLFSALNDFTTAVANLLPHSPYCDLSLGISYSTKALKQFEAEVKGLNTTVGLGTSSNIMSGGGIGQPLSSPSTSSTNNMTIIIQGDVKDEDTIRRIERGVNRSRAMFTG